MTLSRRSEISEISTGQNVFARSFQVRTSSKRKTYSDMRRSRISPGGVAQKWALTCEYLRDLLSGDIERGEISTRGHPFDLERCRQSSNLPSATLGTQPLPLHPTHATYLPTACSGTRIAASFQLLTRRDFDHD